MAVESFSTEKNSEMKSSINTKCKGRYLDHWAPLLIVVIILGKIINGGEPVIAKVVKAP